MNTNSNTYTVIYATVMVIVVAVILALAASLLKEKQQRNIEIERKQMILRSVHLGKDVATAPSKEDYIEQEYGKYIIDTSIVESGKELTLYLCNHNGEKYYIVPLKGAGLWGPIWGYISIKNDFNTVYGAVFDHKGETPGLGAEIATAPFFDQFANKKILDDKGNFVSVEVVKGGANASNPHQVDAISGGTITSKAVEEMILKNIGEYLSFFKAQQNLSTLSNPVNE